MRNPIQIHFPYLADGLDTQVEITRAAAQVGAAIVSTTNGEQYDITFPSERAARRFLQTAFPDREPAHYDAIIAARNSISY